MVVIVQIQTGRKVKISGHYNNQKAATSRPAGLDRQLAMSVHFNPSRYGGFETVPIMCS
jgi:hypothetical protein